MNRVYAGATAALAFTVTTGGAFTANVRDPLNRKVQASVSETGGTATVTINADAWADGASGIGRVEVIRTSGSTKSVEASERFRLLPGFSAEENSDYAA